MVMVLLVLGALLRSGLALAGELHATEHQVHASMADHDHTHDGDDVPAAGEGAVQDHAQGLHGLLHHGTGAMFDLFFALEWFTPSLRGEPPSAVGVPDFSPEHPTTPFRPPIA